MNFSCDKCNRRYSIADEKVRGKLVKIRCKNCQHIITVRGSDTGEWKVVQPVRAPAAQPRPAQQVVAPKPTPKPTSDPPTEWHAVIKGQQAGPLGRQTIQKKIELGEITARTFFWKPGMPDWRRAHELPEVTLFFRPAAATSAVTKKEVAKPEEAPAAWEESATVIAENPFGPEGGERRTVTDPRLGELFKEVENEEPPTSEAIADPAFAIAQEDSETAAAAAEPDPFASLGAIDPSKLGPPGEQTQFFIAQAGVNKRNPPWKIAAFVVGAVALPLGLVYALSTLNVVPLEITRVDAQGREVKESVFSVAGVTGLGDLLLGKKRRPIEQPSRPTPEGPPGRAKGTGPRAAAGPSEPVPGTVQKRDLTSADMADLYGGDDKADFTPKGVAGGNAPPKDTGGEVAKEDLLKVVGQSLKAFQDCIETELKKNPDLKPGKFVLVATVGGSGAVKKAEVQDRVDIEKSALGDCLRNRAKRMVFAGFAGEDIDLEIPLIVSKSF